MAHKISSGMFPISWFLKGSPHSQVQFRHIMEPSHLEAVSYVGEETVLPPKHEDQEKMTGQKGK